MEDGKLVCKPDYEAARAKGKFLDSNMFRNDYNKNISKKRLQQTINGALKTNIKILNIYFVNNILH